MSNMIKSHKDLIVWQKSIKLVTDVYRATEKFPKSELYGLTNQIRRSAVSIPSNIAEGSGRRSRKEYIQFLYIALGSVAELDTQLIISYKLNYLSETRLEDELTEIKRMLIGLIQSIGQH